MKPIKVKPGTPLTMNPDDKSTFAEWMLRVDTIFTHARGISVYDLPDCPFHDWYDARVRPIRAANRALRAAGGEE
jgi:hypothetical protein